MSIPGSPQSSVVGVIYTSQIGRIYPSQPQTSALPSTPASRNGGGIVTPAAVSSSATSFATPVSTSTPRSSSSPTHTTSSNPAVSTGAAGVGGEIASSATSSSPTISAPTSNTAQSSVNSAAPTSSQTAGAVGAGPNSAASSNGSNHNYRNHVVIPAAVVCSIVGALLIALLLWFCVFRKRRRTRASKDPDASAAVLNRYSPDVVDEKNYTLPRVDTGTPGLGPFAAAAPVAATAAPFMAVGYHKEMGPETSNSIPFAATGPQAMTAVPYMTAGLHKEKETGNSAAVALPNRRTTTSSLRDPSDAPWVAQPLRHFKRQSLRSSATSSPAGEAMPFPGPTGYRDTPNMLGSDQRSYAPASPPSYFGTGSAASGLGTAAVGGATLGGAAIASSPSQGLPNTQTGTPSTALPTGPLPAVPSSPQQYQPYRQPGQDYDYDSEEEAAYSGTPPEAFGAVRTPETSTPTRAGLNTGLSALEEASAEDSASLYSDGRRDGGTTGLSSVVGSQRIPREHDAYDQPSYDQAPVYRQSLQTQPAPDTQPAPLNFAGGTFYSDRDSLQRQSLDVNPQHGGTFLESPRDSGLPQSSRALDNEPESNPRPGLGAREDYYTAPTGLGFGQSQSQADPQPRDQSQNSAHTRNTSSGLWSGLTDSSDSTSAEPEPPLYRSGTVTSGTARIHDGPWSGTIARGGPSGAAAVTGAVPETSDSAPRSEAGSEDWASGSQPDSSRRQSEHMLVEERVGYRRDSVREVAVMGRGKGGESKRESGYATPGSGQSSSEWSTPRKLVGADNVGIAR